MDVDFFSNESILRSMYPHLDRVPLPILSAYRMFDLAYQAWSGGHDE